MTRELTVTTLASALAIACAHGSGHPCPKVTVPMGVEGLGATAPTAFELPTRVSECMDCSVDPCEDFHRYACGRWIAAFDGPKPMAAIGVAEVVRQHERRLDAIYTDLARPRGGTSSPHARFLAACLDGDDRVAAGTSALAPALAMIDAVADADGFLRAAGELARIGVRGPFDFRVISSTTAQALSIHLAPSGMRPAPSDATESPVQRYLVRTFVALGDSAERAQVRAALVRTLEKALRPRTASYAPLATTRAALPTMPELAALGPVLDAAGVDPNTPLLLNPKATAELLATVNATRDALTLQSYLRARLIDTYAAHAEGLERPLLDLHQTTLGVAPTRVSLCREATGEIYTEAVDRAYLEDHFDAEARDQARDLLDSVARALDRRMPQVPWLSTAAVTRARVRLRRVRRNVGYPSRWPEPLGVELGDRHLDNVVAVQRAKWDRALRRLGEPEDGTWTVAAHTANAYYDEFAHTVSFPAAVLQAPLFQSDYPMAYSFGAIGSIMGHELTHAYDLSAWLGGPEAELPGVEVVEARRAAERCIVDDYEASVSRPEFVGLGPKIVREAMADLGGLSLAHRAFAHAESTGRARGAQPWRGIRGVTNEQLFFIAYAQSMCLPPRAESLLAKAGDSHPPASYRVNGVVAQIPAFAAAFACEPGSRLAPADRCGTW